jgi:O-acetyl-ADP-ribose deacetylase
MDKLIRTKKINKTILTIKISDITEQDSDAIVNAANKKLSPGGGVSCTIHKVAGPFLWEECKKIGFCNTGHAIITKGYNLKSKCYTYCRPCI